MTKGKSSSNNPFDNLPAGMSLPYHYQGQIWKMRILKQKPNGQMPAVGEEEYYTVPGGSEALYQADNIKPGFPVVLVDEEMDTLSIQQAASSIAVAAGLGGLKTARSQPWVDLLKQASIVLVSFPKTGEGQEATRWWTQNLPHAKSWPIPHPHHSVNAMLIAKVNIQRWILSGIEEGLI